MFSKSFNKRGPSSAEFLQNIQTARQTTPQHPWKGKKTVSFYTVNHDGYITAQHTLTERSKHYSILSNRWPSYEITWCTYWRQWNMKDMFYFTVRLQGLWTKGLYTHTHNPPVQYKMLNHIHTLEWLTSERARRMRQAEWRPSMVS